VKQGERRAQAQARLIQAATELVGKGGFVRASVEDIGATAGMSRGAVNFHFGSKAALLDALLQAKIAEWSEAAPRAATAEPGATLLSVLDAHWGAWLGGEENPRLLLMFVYEGLGPSTHLRPALRDLRERLEGYIDDRVVELQDAGAIESDVNPAEVTRMLIGPLFGVVAQAVLDDQVDLQGVYDEFRAAVGARWPESAV
jgi:AcrR family transcriptional regulator